MPRTPDMFAELKPPRAAPRVLMKATDHSFCDETPDHPELGHMVCGKCGHDAGWMHFATRTDVKNGEPCQVCNALPNVRPKRDTTA
jgi:hypothetical protein